MFFFSPAFRPGVWRGSRFHSSARRGFFPVHFSVGDVARFTVPLLRPAGLFSRPFFGRGCGRCSRLHSSARQGFFPVHFSVGDVARFHSSARQGFFPVHFSVGDVARFHSSARQGFFPAHFWVGDVARFTVPFLRPPGFFSARFRPGMWRGSQFHSVPVCAEQDQQVSCCTLSVFFRDPFRGISFPPVEGFFSTRFRLRKVLFAPAQGSFLTVCRLCGVSFPPEEGFFSAHSGLAKGSVCAHARLAFHSEPVISGCALLFLCTVPFRPSSHPRRVLFRQ